MPAELVELVMPPMPDSEMFCPYRILSAVFWCAGSRFGLGEAGCGTDQTGLGKKMENTYRPAAHLVSQEEPSLSLLTHTCGVSITNLYKSIDVRRLGLFASRLSTHSFALIAVHLESFEAVVPVTSQDVLDRLCYSVE